MSQSGGIANDAPASDAGGSQTAPRSIVVPELSLEEFCSRVIVNGTIDTSSVQNMFGVEGPGEADAIKFPIAHNVAHFIFQTYFGNSKEPMLTELEALRSIMKSVTCPVMKKLGYDVTTLTLIAQLRMHAYEGSLTPRGIGPSLMDMVMKRWSKAKGSNEVTPLPKIPQWAQDCWSVYPKWLVEHSNVSTGHYRPALVRKVFESIKTLLPWTYCGSRSELLIESGIVPPVAEQKPPPMPSPWQTGSTIDSSLEFWKLVAHARRQLLVFPLDGTKMPRSPEQDRWCFLARCLSAELAFIMGDVVEADRDCRVALTFFSLFIMKEPKQRHLVIYIMLMWTSCRERVLPLDGDEKLLLRVAMHTNCEQYGDAPCRRRVMAVSVAIPKIEKIKAEAQVLYLRATEDEGAENQPDHAIHEHLIAALDLYTQALEELDATYEYERSHDSTAYCSSCDVNTWVTVLCDRSAILALLRRTDLAMKDAERALKMHPPYVRAHILRASCFCELDMRNEAIEACELGMRLAGSENELKAYSAMLHKVFGGTLRAPPSTQQQQGGGETSASSQPSKQEDSQPGSRRSTPEPMEREKVEKLSAEELGHLKLERQATAAASDVLQKTADRKASSETAIAASKERQRCEAEVADRKKGIAAKERQLQSIRDSSRKGQQKAANQRKVEVQRAATELQDEKKRLTATTKRLLEHESAAEAEDADLDRQIAALEADFQNVEKARAAEESKHASYKEEMHSWNRGLKDGSIKPGTSNFSSSAAAAVASSASSAGERQVDATRSEGKQGATAAGSDSPSSAKSTPTAGPARKKAAAATSPSAAISIPQPASVKKQQNTSTAPAATAGAGEKAAVVTPTPTSDVSRTTPKSSSGSVWGRSVVSSPPVTSGNDIQFPSLPLSEAAAEEQAQSPSSSVNGGAAKAAGSPAAHPAAAAAGGGKQHGKQFAVSPSSATVTPKTAPSIPVPKSKQQTPTLSAASPSSSATPTPTSATKGGGHQGSSDGWSPSSNTGGGKKDKGFSVPIPRSRQQNA